MSFVGTAESIYNGWYFLAHERVRMEAMNQISMLLGLYIRQ